VATVIVDNSVVVKMYEELDSVTVVEMVVVVPDSEVISVLVVPGPEIVVATPLGLLIDTEVSVAVDVNAVGLLMEREVSERVVMDATGLIVDEAEDLWKLATNSRILESLNLTR
jgi:hypothetical protein